ncbi:MAG: DUF934 domain-containing protein [Halioglobus sp.]
MPKLIKNGAIVDDNWLPADDTLKQPAANQIHSLSQWLALPDKSGSAVQLEPGDGVEPLLEHLSDVAVVAVNFPGFMDGRGFSYARELRERGYRGEIRATGHFIRDQLTYLSRVGCDAFQFADEALLEPALASLQDFSDYYQAAIDQPQPLFRRRA